MNSPSTSGTTQQINEAAHHETVLEVGTERIARVYAEALFRAAAMHQQTEEIAQDLQALLDDVLKKNPFFDEFLGSGAVDRKRKAQIIQSIFKNRASEILVNFLLVLNDHERLGVLRPIAAAYRQLLDEKAGKIPVLVRSAVPLSADQTERLRAQLRTSLHKEPVFETQVDPDLLGGMVVRVGDRLYDQSVRAQLESIRDQIIARSSHEIQSGRNRFSVVGGN